MKFVKLNKIIIFLAFYFILFASSCYDEVQLDPGIISVSVKTKNAKGYESDSTFVKIGETIALEAEVETESADKSKNVIWSSSNNQIATVDSTGLVTIKKTATAGSLVTIIATSKSNNEKSGQIVLTPYSIDNIRIVSKDNVESGGSLKLSLIFTSTPEDIPSILKPITWASSDTSRATVDNTGVVEGLKVGSVTISATVDKKKVEKQIKINPIAPNANNAIVFYSTDEFTIKTFNNSQNWKKAGDPNSIRWCNINSNNDSDWGEWTGKEIKAEYDNTVGYYCIFMKGKDNTNISSANEVTRFVITCKNNAKVTLDGNMMNLLDYTKDYNDPKNLIIESEYCFANLFANCADLEALGDSFSLPATTLAKGSYANMFYNCTSLTSVPTLPAKNISDFCYNGMLAGCTSLTFPPALPATTLKSCCYNSMFKGCTSLNLVPALPATTLEDACYLSMFEGCSSLKFSETNIGGYINKFTIGDASRVIDATKNMFANTAGRFVNDPTGNTTYYTSNDIVSAE